MKGPLKNGRSAVSVPGDPDPQQMASTLVGHTDAQGATATSAGTNVDSWLARVTGRQPGLSRFVMIHVG